MNDNGKALRFPIEKTGVSLMRVTDVLEDAIEFQESMSDIYAALQDSEAHDHILVTQYTDRAVVAVSTADTAHTIRMLESVISALKEGT
jgi:hypothetical protein